MQGLAEWSKHGTAAGAFPTWEATPLLPLPCATSGFFVDCDRLPSFCFVVVSCLVGRVNREGLSLRSISQCVVGQLYVAHRIDRRMRYGGFGSIDLSGVSFGVCAPLNVDDSIAVTIVGRMLVSVKKVVAEGSSAAINLSVANWRAFGVGGVEWFHNFVLPLMRVRGRTIGLGGGAGVSYSGIADGHRLASVMVVSLPAAYVEIRVATGFAAYVLYGCCFSSLLKK